MNQEAINLSFLLINDPNMKIILNDPDVSMAIKNLIVKILTDNLFVSKLSNPIQKDDFQLEAKKTYKKDKEEVLTKYEIMLDTFKIRNKDNDYIKRHKSYLKYLYKNL
jgi:hypothetical protein